MSGRLALAALLSAGLVLAGCGGALVRLAKDEQWQEIDHRARAMKQPPRNQGARAWAQALVALGKVDEARAVLQRDFRKGGHEASLLALADLERSRGLLGVATARYVRLLTIDLDDARGAASAPEICALLRARARASARLGEALAADTDMRRMALVCPAIDAADRRFMAELRPAAEAVARGQRSLDPIESPAPDRAALEAALAERLELARKRNPRAVMALAEAEGMQLPADDVAMLLAAEFAGALGPGMVSPRRLLGWIGDGDLDGIVAAIDSLPDGVREYALLRLATARGEDDGAARQGWIVTAMAALEGQGPHEAAKAWRVAAAAGDLSGAEFALTTNLRDMIPPADPVAPVGSADPSEGKLGGRAWALRVPVDRRSFDLLLTLARLLELRGEPAQALSLRRAVIVGGYEAGLSQVAPAAVEEVRRQLVLGNPRQALAIAEVVPGPLADEVLPVVASALALMQAADPSAVEADLGVIRQALGDAWFESWDPRLDNAAIGLDLQDRARCPSLGTWLDPSPEAAAALQAVGLDPARSRAALEAAFAGFDRPEAAVALAEALESDLALSCSASAVIPLLYAGLHEVTLATLDERLIHAPELAGPMQEQLHAELALAHGKAGRAEQRTISAAASSVDPRSLWARAAVSGRSFIAAPGAREYTLLALRQVLAHSDGLENEAARRELLLIRLRDVDGDEILRGGESPAALDELRALVEGYIVEAPAQRRWSRRQGLLETLAGEARADAQAWELLLAVLITNEARRAHPQAIAALERAALQGEGAGAGAGEEEGHGAPIVDPAAAALAFLGDADALCDLEPWRRVDALDAASIPILVGVGTACGPKPRAEALRTLLVLAEAVGPSQRDALRRRILASPAAVASDPSQPGALIAVPALVHESLLLRVALGLDLAPAWAVL